VIATHVTLNNYRNWTRLSLDPHPRLNLVTGPNAQGKSNLLEALYALVTTRPYRAQKDIEVVRFGEPFAHVHAAFEAAGRSVSCEIVWERKAEGRHRKEVRLNKQPVSRLAEVFGVARMVLFAPRDLELVTGGPEARRRYLDVVLSQLYPTHLHALTQYNRVLAERNRVLRMQAARVRIDPALLEALTEQMVGWGASIIDRRRAVLERLGGLLEQMYRHLSGQKDHVRMKYVSSADPAPEESTQEALARLAKSRARVEAERGVTMFGPHRDDVSIVLEKHPMRNFGSQGQIRCMSLAMRLAEAELLTRDGGEPPLLLLDDCLSEMDLNRQDALWAYLATREQVFLTTSVWPREQRLPFEGRIWRVYNGEVEDAKCCA
jgi:DNA replication and repair protein RecF